jgi:hypothetical protein
MDPSIVFVTGCFRSGTTLTARILHQHESVAGSTDIWLPLFRTMLVRSLKAEGVLPPLPKVANLFYATENPEKLPASSNNGLVPAPFSDDELGDIRKYCYYYGYRFNSHHASKARALNINTIRDFPNFLVNHVDLLPLESAFFSSLCSCFGPLLTFGDSPTG